MSFLREVPSALGTPWLPCAESELGSQMGVWALLTLKCVLTYLPVFS